MIIKYFQIKIFNKFHNYQNKLNRLRNNKNNKNQMQELLFFNMNNKFKDI